MSALILRRCGPLLELRLSQALLQAGTTLEHPFPTDRQPSGEAAGSSGRQTWSLQGQTLADCRWSLRSISSTPLALQSAAKPQAQEKQPAADGLVVDDSAVQRLRQLQGEQGKAVMLRIEVEGGGCSGFQYKFSLDTQTGPDDLVFGPEGAHVVCDSVSFGLIRGSKIEWEDSLMRSAFVVGSNPNSEASCGCGSSFTARVITPPSKSKAAAGGGRKS